MKVLNRIKAEIQRLSAYRKADTHRNQQAVTLNLTSYDWAFDIVPAVEVTDYLGGVSHYLIPNGSGDWMRTDPRIDQATITRVNQRHNGLFLPLVRLLKQWNGRTHNKPRLPSYYFETLAVKVFDYAPVMSSLQEGVARFFATAGMYVSSTCPAPTGHGPALDAALTWETKQKVTAALGTAAQSASYAQTYERQGKTKEAITWWSQVFGPSFPTYG